MKGNAGCLRDGTGASSRNAPPLRDGLRVPHPDRTCERTDAAGGPDRSHEGFISHAPIVSITFIAFKGSF